MDHIILDANNLLYRCGHSTGFLTLKDGTPCGAAFGFVRCLLSAYRSELGAKGGRLHVVWDGTRSERRIALLPTYKHRSDGSCEGPVDPALRAKIELKKQERQTILRQASMVKELLGHLGVFQYEGSAVEADDVIAVLCECLNNGESNIAVVSGDDDFRQLVKGKTVLVKPNGERLYAEDVPQPVEAMTEKCLTGCKSDNIPGLWKVGEVTARALMEWVRSELGGKAPVEPSDLAAAGKTSLEGCSAKGRALTGLKALCEDPELVTRNQQLVDLRLPLKWPEVWEAALNPDKGRAEIKNYLRELNVLGWPSLEAMLPEAEAVAGMCKV